MSDNFGRKQTYVPPEGQIRQSQVVTTFGPGAMVDLIDQAVLVGGLDFWNYSKEHGRPIISEPRLRDAIAEQMRKNKLGELSVEEAFREPPPCDDRAPTRAAGIQTLEFPQWFVCQNPRCRTLVRARDGLERAGARYKHRCNGDKKSDCVPVRFVGACKHGHIQDWPWIEFCHRGVGKICNAPDLTLDEGATGDFSEIRIRCRTCPATEKLSTALARDAAPECGGRRPWLGAEGDQECQPGTRLRLLVRTATNSYFPMVVSALSIPDQTHALADAVAEVWDVLSIATPELLPALRQIPKVKDKLAAYSDGDILKAVAARKDGRTLTGEPLRTAEYRQFLAADFEAPGDRPERGVDFFVRRLKKPDVPAGIARIVLAQKLREVRAQIGFTRIEPRTADLQGEYDLGVQPASLGLTTSWLPATEIHGEGLFIQLDEEAVWKWEQREVVQRRRDALLDGFNAWVLRFEDPDHRPQFPDIRFYLLHSLSHLLITAISLECGYAASAIRERIYCAPHDDPRTAMAGILLSTGTPGTEGTLGGLVEQGRQLRAHLREAWDRAVLCSNDPVCAAHSPEDDKAERHLEGAACHGCLFIAECSCERFNGFLDRALVVPTIGHDPELAFFRIRP